MKIYRKTFITILLLIGITSAAMAYIGVYEKSSSTGVHNGGFQAVSINTRLVQDKVLQGSDGRVAVALTLTGASRDQQMNQEIQPVDLVVVLDRSGSMGGRKIDDARMAVIQLMEQLSPEDRMAVLTYSNHVKTLSPLVWMNTANRERLSARVQNIRSGGGTNLGSGLERGIATLRLPDAGARQRKLILISDGLANQGITDPYTLGAMAAGATEHHLAVSTVGVGYDFNEILMTTIADHGSGNYYFLEDPRTIAAVFNKEFETARSVVANGLEIRIPLEDGIQLVDAGGFPIVHKENVAIIRPGEILSNQQRKLFLTFQLPTEDEHSFTLGNFDANYLHNGEKLVVTSEESLTVHCVRDPKEVVASIDSETWSEQVVKEDYSRLKEEVAKAIKKGKKAKALKTIEEYEVRNRALNDNIGSASVSQNLEEDVKSLRQNVEDTFTGAPAAIAEKKKQQAKTLQYESYRIRRDKK